MAQVLTERIVHGDGATNPLSRVVSDRYGPTVRVRARARPSLNRPAQPPSVFLDTTEDGKKWTELIDLGSVEGEVVEGEATISSSADVRVRWRSSRRRPRVLDAPGLARLASAAPSGRRREVLASHWSDGKR